MNEVLVCIGANGVDKAEAVDRAFAVLSGMTTVTADSGSYPTPPEGTPANTEPYNNRVLTLTTPLSYDELHRRCKEYETGRREAHTGKGVAVDIDIVTFNSEILRPLDFNSAYMAAGLKIINSRK